MTAHPHVSLDLAAPADAATLSNLVELYIHDLSEVFPVQLGPDGRFGYQRLPLYWSEPESRFPFLIRCQGRIAGFVLAMRGSPADADPEVLDVAEFFVLRRERRHGVGRRAAFLLWDRLPGRWTVRAAERNAGAVPFWARIIAEYSHGTASERQAPGDATSWRVFSFDTERIPTASSNP